MALQEPTGHATKDLSDLIVGSRLSQGLNVKIHEWHFFGFG